MEFSFINGGLDSILKDAIQEIETSTGKDIKFEIVEQLDVACARFDFDKKYAGRILVPQKSKAERGTIYHELLHLKRGFVDGISAPGSFADESLADLNNLVEHSVICKVEAEHYPDREVFWLKRVSKIFKAKTKYDMIRVVLQTRWMKPENINTVESSVSPLYFEIKEKLKSFHAENSEEKEKMLTFILEEIGYKPNFFYLSPKLLLEEWKRQGEPD